MTADDNGLLRGLVDALLPGGNGFPAASATGMTGLLAARLLAADSTLLDRIAESLRTLEALPDTTERWHDAAARLEADEPKLFEELRKYAYLTYYEQPGTIAAIRTLGFRYNDAPLPDGYPAERFDASTDAPRHTRGRWVATEQIQRVDLNRLSLEETQ